MSEPSSVDAAREHLLKPRIARALSSFMAYDIISTLATIFLTRWLLEYLGKSTYGYMAAVGSAVGYMALLDMGLGQTITKYVAEHASRAEDGQLNEVINTTLALYLALGGAALVVAVGISPLVPSLFDVASGDVSVSRLFFILASTKLAFGLPLSTFGGICYGLGRIDIFNASRVLQSTLNFALITAAMTLDSNLAEIEAFAMLAPFAGAALNVYFIRRLFPQIEFGKKFVRRDVAHKLFSFSVYFTINHVIVLLVFHTDNIIIGATLGTAAVTGYAISQKVIQSGMKLTFKLADTLYPTYSALDAINNRDQLRRTYDMATTYSLAVGAGAALIIGAYSQWLIYLWTGWDGYAGDHVMWVLAAVILIHTPVRVAGGLIAACGHLKQITLWSIAEGALNLVLSLWWVHYWGLFGVALATTVSMLVTTAWFVPWYGLRLVELPLKRYFSRSVLPGLMAFAPMLGVYAVLKTLVPATRGLHAAWQAPLLVVVLIGGILALRAYRARTPDIEGL